MADFRSIVWGSRRRKLQNRSQNIPECTSERCSLKQALLMNSGKFGWGGMISQSIEI
jgi:hypothetical protein